MKPTDLQQGKWLRGMDSNHDNQLQRLVSCRLDDPGIFEALRRLHHKVAVTCGSIPRALKLQKGDFRCRERLR